LAITNLFSALKYEAGEINTIHGRQKKETLRYPAIVTTLADCSKFDKTR